MNSSLKSILAYFTIVVVCLFFLFLGLTRAKPFLSPLAVAAILAMIILPVARWVESKGVKRGWVSFFSTLVILSFFILLGGMLTIQANRFVEGWPQKEQKLEAKVNQLQQFFTKKTGISRQQLEQNLSSQILGTSLTKKGESTKTDANEQRRNQQNFSFDDIELKQPGSSLASYAGNFVLNLFGFLGTFLLTFVYIFFFLLYRSKFKKSLIKMVPEEQKERTRGIITESAHVSQNYLFGKLILVILLAVIYSIGLSFSGLENALLIAVLAAILTLIPYLGNVLGYGIAVSLALLSGNGLTAVVGITLTFVVTQFIESYFLQPYIVGDKVNLNPVATIVVVVLGSSVWGIVGMLLSIPALGILKVVFDHIPSLKPLGYMLGQEDTGKDKDG